MDDVTRARSIAEDDPEGALALLEKHPVLAPCRGFRIHETERRLELSRLRVDLYERLGRHEAAAAEQADAMRFLEMRLDDLDRELNPAKSSFPFLFPTRGWYLERMGRRTDATRCYVFLADYLLARAGDAGAKAGLKAAAAAGGGGTAVPATAASGLAEALGTAISMLGGGGGFAFGYKAYNKSSDRRDGRKWRAKVLSEGRAVEFAQCESCGYVVAADFMTCRCVAGHKVAEVRVVALEDAPPAWYHDPWGRYKFRFWSGAAWTSQVASGGTVAEDSPGDSDAQ